MMKLNTEGIRIRSWTRVTRPLRVKVKFLRRRNLRRSSASAVEALMIMMTGASMRSAKAKATPYAARLKRGSGRRAMTAARNGPSTDIMIQVAASGSQKRKMAFCVRSGVTGPHGRRKVGSTRNLAPFGQVATGLLPFSGEAQEGPVNSGSSV